MADPIPTSHLPDPPAYELRQTDAAFVVEVVVPYNEGTVAEAKKAALDAINALTIDSIPDLRTELQARPQRAETAVLAMIYG
ncbi:hypothetical protein [Methylobacterium brachiatum]|uniref:hypothetical protein n=1 Tax=Methylobacterium brachiatum TaxID=269660 RepID=UPI000EFC6FAE|nr:hypothetical protein [Methylobacterium brachiatum]AYO83649.1 hypothetical protein EBB05_16170 [Methylobacterium brachiatum]